MEEHAQGAVAADYQDRRTGLLAVGIVQILLGCFCGLMVILVVFGQLIAQKTGAVPADTKGMLFGAGFYVALAAWFISMGIGSIRGRRWARALSLVVSSVWLVCGIGGFIVMWAMLPAMTAQMGQDPKMPAAAVTIMKVVMCSFMFVFYLLLPGILVLFYRSEHVAATCRRMDPQPRWTDRCPLPVLGGSMMFGLWALTLPFMGVYGWAVPFFGIILNGAAGAAVVFLAVAVCVYTAYGTYRLQIAAWRAALVVALLWSVSIAITFWRIGLIEYYQQMNLNEQQLEIIKKMYQSPRMETAMTLMMAFWMIGILGYLAYIRRYFFVPRSDSSSSCSS